MATLRIFAHRAAFLRSVRSSNVTATKSRYVPAVAQIQCRWGSYKSSPIYETPEDYTDYDVTKDPKEWAYVERVLPYKVIPKAPTTDADLPSGWKPACASSTDNPYFIERTKNHMQPVYLDITFRGLRKITVISKIQGDIWALERDVQRYMKKCTGYMLGSQIHEFAGILKLKGDHVSRVKEWMDTKGF